MRAFIVFCVTRILFESQIIWYRFRSCVDFRGNILFFSFVAVERLCRVFWGKLWLCPKHVTLVWEIHRKKTHEDLFPEHRSSRCFVITGLSRFWQETRAEYLTANEILTGPRGCGSAAASSCFTYCECVKQPERVVQKCRVNQCVHLIFYSCRKGR